MKRHVFFLLCLLFVTPLFAQYEWLSSAQRQKVDSVRAVVQEEIRLRQLARAEAIAKLKNDSTADSLRAQYAKKERQERAKQTQVYQTQLDALGSTDTTSLRLTYNNFTTVPRAVIEQQKLTSLNFTNSALACVPRELFTEMPQLTSINFTASALTHRAIYAARNRSINRLSLSKNHLEKIPRKLKKLRGLTYLDLSGNRLGTQKRITMPRLTELRVLDLSNNQLTRLPRKLKRLKNLEVLKLEANQLKSLKGLEKLKNLKELVVSDNPIALTPTVCRVQLRNLRRLVMQGCGLFYIPSEVGLLDSLRFLILPENYLFELPKELGQLSGLENLMLYKNRLEYIPAELFNLTNLVWLDLYHNELSEISEQIGQLQKIEILFLSHNKLESLPKNIAKLPQLKELYIHHNRLTSLPTSYANLQKLRYLLIQHNFITEFPRAILSLKNLEELDISANQLTTLPEEIIDLEKLTKFYVNDNAIEVGTMEHEKLKAIMKVFNDRSVSIKFDYQ